MGKEEDSQQLGMDSLRFSGVQRWSSTNAGAGPFSLACAASLKHEILTRLLCKLLVGTKPS